METVPRKKLRITYEARHIVGNYLGRGDPWAQNGKGAIVVKGVLARLSNISENGTWIQDEEFEYAGKKTREKQGDLQAKS